MYDGGFCGSSGDCYPRSCGDCVIGTSVDSCGWSNHARDSDVESSSMVESVDGGSGSDCSGSS
jgi:hypothetical protein